jgi:hypothetical protein
MESGQTLDQGETGIEKTQSRVNRESEGLTLEKAPRRLRRPAGPLRSRLVPGRATNSAVASLSRGVVPTITTLTAITPGTAPVMPG